jgi:hypothetical protein
MSDAIYEIVKAFQYIVVWNDPTEYMVEEY